MTRLRDLVRRERKPSIRLPGWLERATSVGIVTEDPRVARRQRVTNVAAFATAGNALSHLIINSYHDFDGLSIIHVYNAVMTVAPLLGPAAASLRPERGGDGAARADHRGNTFVVWMLGTREWIGSLFHVAGAMLLFFGVENWRLFLGVFRRRRGGNADRPSTLRRPNGLILPSDHDLRAMLFSQAMINTIVINALMVFYALTSCIAPRPNWRTSTPAPRRCFPP